MEHLKRYRALGVLAVLLLAATVAAVLTRQQAPSTRGDTKHPLANAPTDIDDRLLEEARALAPLADTAPELALAQQALRVADHEFDQAFAMAMREAALAPPPASGPLQQFAARIAELKKRIGAGEKQVAALAKGAGTDEEVMAQLELAKAQLALDQDELAEAQLELQRQGGDRRANLERLLKEHEDAQHAQPQMKAAAPPPTGTLFDEARAWLQLEERRGRLETAEKQAASRAAALSRQHDQLEKPAQQTSASAAGSGGDGDDEQEEEDTSVVLERLRRLSDQKKTLVQLDGRIQDSQTLADVYRRWDALVKTRQDSVLHWAIVLLAAILAIVMLVMLAGRVVRHAFRNHADRRGAHQMRVMLTLAAEIVGGVAIALIVFGPPTQLSTIVGLTTAGLTVVLRDFIVAFFGWFVLMGKNGVRIGDWVEIEGVGGEVIEIGLLKTVLLETGNWTNSGHPTGRRVAFVNKYAIENHYFNFSTAGQWLWDELRMTLPPTGDAYHLAIEIRELVEKETEADARLAEQDWERATRQYHAQPFSARPVVDLQPSAAGLEVAVRYITRAPRRFEVKSRLFQAIVERVHKPSPA